MEHDYMIEALAPNGTNHPLHVRSLPRRAGRGPHFMDAHVSHLFAEVKSSDAARNAESGTASTEIPFPVCLSLDDAIRSTAEDAGVLDDYTNAVDEYRKAMKLDDLWEATKEQGVRILKYAIAGAATAYAIKSASGMRDTGDLVAHASHEARAVHYGPRFTATSAIVWVL